MTNPISVDLPAGTTLQPSSLGGYAVAVDGEFAGWMHRNGPDRWNAYVRAVPPRAGRFLGSFRLGDAVRRIARAAGPDGDLRC